MTDAKRMHALMIGQPHLVPAAPAKPKPVRVNGRFAKASPAPAAAPAGDYEQQLEAVKAKMQQDYAGPGRDE